jgi:hypothetical protein
MCAECPMKEKCEHIQKVTECSSCQYAAKDDAGNVTGCACPPAKAAAQASAAAS